MRNLTSSKLPRIGINPLTSESCAYGLRTLCDLNAQGVELVQAFLGLNDEAFLPNWNSAVGEYPAVASVMLTRTALHDLMLFALLRDYHYVVEADGIVFSGFNAEDIQQSPMLALYLVGEAHGMKEGRVRLHRNISYRSQQPRIGDRNVHACSARTT